MGAKRKIIQALQKATVDKPALNKTALKWKKHLSEADKALGGGKKKKK